MNYKYLFILLYVSILITVLTSCQQKNDLDLKLGQTLVEVIDNEAFYFEEYIRVDNHSIKGKSFEEYIKKYSHNNYDAFIKSNWVDFIEIDEDENDVAYETLQDLNVIDIDRYNIKNTITYIKVPGKIRFIYALNDAIDYKLINDSMIRIDDWGNETSINIVYSEEEYKKLKKPKENYILFDFTSIDKLVYKEIIAIKLEDYSNVNIITPLNTWLRDKNYKDYEELLDNIPFKWAINKDKATQMDLDNYEKALVLSFGNIISDTYIRVPNEILFITEGVDYKYIDENTLLIKEGNVTIIYKD